jgi:hypothetical protein
MRRLPGAKEVFGMDRLMRLALAGVAAAGLLVAGCEDRSRSVLDRDEGPIEETREGIDRAGEELKEDVER